MNCPDTNNLLQQYLDTQIPAEWPYELEQHLSECSECRQMFAAARVLDSGLKVLPTPEPPSYLTDNILDAVLNERRLRFRRRVTVGLAVAAAVLLAVLPFASYFLTQKSGPTVVHKDTPPKQPKMDPNKQENPENKQSPNKAIRTAKLSEQVVELQNVMWSVTDDTQEQAKSWLSELAKNTDLPQNTTDTTQFDAGEPVRETGAVVTAGLQPVAKSAQKAVTYFFREIPTWKSKGKSIQ